MKKVLKDVSFILLLLKMCIIFGQEPVAEKRIVIDAGHGGKDSGAIGINGLMEKDIVFDLAKEILNLNYQLENPFDIYLTRYSDTLISLSDRSMLAKKLNANLFISLHCNHSDNPIAKGIEVFVFNKKYTQSKESVLLAYTIQKAMQRNLGFKSRGVKFANFQVLRETVGYCPSVLVELGFLSNRDESCYFLKTDNIKVMALAILMGLYKYLNNGL